MRIGHLVFMSINTCNSWEKVLNQHDTSQPQASTKYLPFSLSFCSTLSDVSLQQHPATANTQLEKRNVFECGATSWKLLASFSGPIQHLNVHVHVVYTV